MFALALLLLACSSEPVEPVAPPTATPPAPVAPADPVPQPATAADAPKGSIGGEPILPDPVVVGAISTEAVRTGVEAQMASINACWEARAKEREGLAGKVLVKVVIARDGSVSGATTKSSSLRDPPTEACVNEAIAKASFEPLQDGRLAVVSYPLVFPPGS